MKFRFNIGRKIGTGFGVVILLTVVVFYLTNSTLNESKRINEEINDTYNPSVFWLEKLRLHLLETKRLISEWVNFQSSEEAEIKVVYRRIVEREIPFTERWISKLSKRWIDEERYMADDIFLEIDTLLSIHVNIQENLNSWEAYDDPQNQFLANVYLEEAAIQLEEIQLLLHELILKEKENAKKVSNEMIESFNLLQFLVRYLGVVLLLGGFISAYYTTRSIVNPVNKLKLLLLDLSRGIITRRKMKAANDEIGEMTLAMNKVIEGLNQTKDFANAIGSGNYDFPYQPLSDKDSLGHDLLKMRIDLAENERILEEKVKQRTAEVVRQKEEIEHQSEEINRLYHEVTDSIIYAKRIQRAILLPFEKAKTVVPGSFILFKPKDIVSGDFYWIEKKENRVYFAAADCTGHGVPGAFVSIVGYNGLDHSLTFHDKPADILNSLNQSLSRSFHQSEGGGETKDGMDIALCSLDYKTRILNYAGAYNPLYIVRNKELILQKADKFPIGSFVETEKQGFTNNEVQLEKGDTVYVFSDGYQDQFGGKKGKKFMVKRFQDLLIEISDEDIDKQREILDNTIEEWKGELEQVDDILIIGVKIE